MCAGAHRDNQRLGGVSARRSRRGELSAQMSRIRLWPSAAVGEVLPGVVDDLVGTDRADQAGLPLPATPVTVVPQALSSCIAYLRIPPEAPVINTFCVLQTREIGGCKGSLSSDEP